MDKHITAVVDAERLEAAAQVAYYKAAEAFHLVSAKVCALEAFHPASARVCLVEAGSHPYRVLVYEEQVEAEYAMTLADWAWDVAGKRLDAARRAARRAANRAAHRRQLAAAVA